MVSGIQNNKLDGILRVVWIAEEDGEVRAFPPSAIVVMGFVQKIHEVFLAEFFVFEPPVSIVDTFTKCDKMCMHYSYRNHGHRILLQSSSLTWKIADKHLTT